jgi:dihydrofolate reductase
MRLQKYVAPTTLKQPLPWKNSTLLEGDAAQAVARLEREPGKDLVILGSGELVQSLMRRNVADEYVLLNRRRCSRPLSGSPTARLRPAAW